MLYQSNAQLLLIGRNINQIAKSLNTSSPTALSTQELKEIKAQIAQHTDSSSCSGLKNALFNLETRYKPIKKPHPKMRLF